MKKSGRIKIEGVQDVIATKPKKGRPFKYPFNALKVGQTFWVPDKNNYVALYVAVWRRNRVSKDQGFVLSRGDRNGRTGFRIQRIR
jgi:hypothetical protein